MDAGDGADIDDMIMELIRILLYMCIAVSETSLSLFSNLLPVTCFTFRFSKLESSIEPLTENERERRKKESVGRDM